MCSYRSISSVWCGFAFRDHKPNIEFFLEQKDGSPVEFSINEFHLWRVALCTRSPCATVTLKVSLGDYKQHCSHCPENQLFELITSFTVHTPRKSLLFELITSFTVHTLRESLSFQLISSFFFHHLQHYTIFGNRSCDRVRKKDVLQNEYKEL